MLEISPKTNLLEQKNYRYTLQDVAEPNLYRDIYDYESVPKIPFNHRRVPMNMPEEIWITDTSFRDGQQSVDPYTPDQIVELYKLMSKLGGPYGIIRQTEFFIYSQKDREALERCRDLGLRFPEITTWIRATKEDFRSQFVGKSNVAVTKDGGDINAITGATITSRGVAEAVTSAIAAAAWSMNTSSRTWTASAAGWSAPTPISPLSTPLSASGRRCSRA